eukprot:363891-Chlamydomonas_euryale.AAC.12
MPRKLTGPWRHSQPARRGAATRPCQRRPPAAPRASARNRHNMRGICNARTEARARARRRSVR